MLIMKSRIGFLLIFMALAACGGETAVIPTPANAPTALTKVEPTAMPTLSPTPQKTAVSSPIAPPPTPTAEPTAPPAATATTAPPTAVVGRDANGAFFYGNPDAAVTLIDFSDFM